MASINKYTEPWKFMAGYSDIPLRVKSTNANSNNFKYVINIIYNTKHFSNGGSMIDIGNGRIGLKILLENGNNFRVGESIILKTNELYSNVYNIIGSDDNNIILDLKLTEPLDVSGYISNVISYKMSPDIEYEAKLDLSGTLKDFVTQDLEDIPDIFEGPNTKFEYSLAIGEVKEDVFRFDDNYYIAGTGVGFINMDMTSVDDINFKVGDTIKIQQEVVKWEFDKEDVAIFEQEQVLWLRSSIFNFVDFRVGQQIDIVGLVDNNNFNKHTTIISKPDDYGIEVDIINNNDAVFHEDGIVYGVPIPEYNTTATITSIYYEDGQGVVIGTDVERFGNTTPIPGTIKSTLDTYTKSNFVNFDGFSFTNKIYNSRFTDKEYIVKSMDPYVIQNRTNELNRISTIYNEKNKYRIEKSTKSWLLLHTDMGLESFGLEYEWLDYKGDTIGTSKLTTEDSEDIYCPIGIDQLIESTNASHTPSLASIEDDIKSYIINGYYVSSLDIDHPVVIKTKELKFFVNDDCSKFDLLHLMWKDKMGSWISYPFKHKHSKSIEIEHNNYYKKIGKFNLENDTYGIDVIDRGEKSFYNRGRDKMKLTSGWIKEFENELIKDLLLSGSVYLQDKDNSLNAIQLDVKKFDFKSKKNEKIYKYEIDIRFSNNDYRF